MSIFDSNYARSLSRAGVEPSQGDSDYWSFSASDLAMGIPRGIAGAASDIVNLPLMAFGTEVPDKFGWDSSSSTIGGDITEGLANFASGFIPGLGIASKIGKGARFAKVANRLDSLADAATESAILARKSGKVAQAAFQARKAKALNQIPELAKYSFAGAIADFAAFDGHEARLSNLLRDYAGLQDPVTEFLAADENDGEIVGRLKNAIEGFGVGFAVDGVISALKIYRAGSKARSQGVDPTPSMVRKAREIRDAQERDLMESFDLDEDKAKYVNLLIDMFGLDRGRLKILAGEDAIKFYDIYTGEVLKQVDAGTFRAADALPEGSPLRYLLSDEELNSIRTPAELARFMEQSNEAVRVFGFLSEPPKSGASGVANTARSARMLSRVIGPSRAQVYFSFTRAIQSEQPAAAAIGMTELVLDSLRRGRTKILQKDVGGMVPVGYEGSITELTRLANDILKRVNTEYKAASKLDPSLTRLKVLDNMDMSEFGGELRFGGTDGDLLNVQVLPMDSHTSRFIPNEMIERGILTDSKGRQITQSWLEAKRDWANNRPEIAATYSSLRQAVKVSGLGSSPIPDRVIRSLSVAVALNREGLSPEEILKRFSKEDLLTGWNLIDVLTRKEIREELQRIGIEPSVIEGLEGLAVRVRTKFGLKAGESISSADVVATKTGSRVLPQGRRAANRGVLLSAADGNVRGFAKAAGDGLSYIGGLNAPNIETAVHEISHVLRHQLLDPRVPAVERMGISDADIIKIEKWAGVSRDDKGFPVWSIEAEERFAEAIVRYLKEGAAPSTGLQAFFKKVSMWLAGSWTAVGKDIPDVSKEVREVFDRLVERGPGIEITGVNTFTPTTAVLRSKTPEISATGGGAGEGSPRSRPQYIYNIDRVSTEGEARTLVREFIDERIASREAGFFPEERWESLGPEIMSNADSVARMLGEKSEFGSFEELRTRGAQAVRDAYIQKEAFRQILADTSARLVKIAQKGANASSAEMYEFLRLRAVSEAIIDEVRILNSAFGRGLNLSRRVPRPRKITTLPSLLPTGPTKSSSSSRISEVGETAADPASRSGAGEGLGPGKGPGKGPGEGPGKGPGEGPGKGPGEGPGDGRGTEEATPSGDSNTAVGGDRLGPDGTAVPDEAAATPGSAPTTGNQSGASLPEDFGVTVNEEIVREAIETAGGREAVSKIMEKVAAAEASGGAEGVISLVRAMKNWGNVIVEYWMNSILSGPVTHMVNMTANTMTLLYLPFERALGAALVGDFPLVAAQIRLYMNYMTQIQDSMKIALRAGAADQSVLEQGMKKVEIDSNSISAAGLGLPEDALSGQAANWIGKVINLPTRLLAAEDEFFKQLHYRAHFKTNLHIEGIKKFKGDTTAAAKWAEKTWGDLLEDGQRYSEANMVKKALGIADSRIEKGIMAPAEKVSFVQSFMRNSDNWDAEAGVLSRQALDQARYATFTTPLDPRSHRVTNRIAAKIQAIANEMPFMRFALPFIRTPTNLLNFAMSRLPGVSPMLYTREAISNFKKELALGGRERQAEIAGRMAFSFGAISTFFLAGQSGILTGGGPRERSRRELWESTGWQPYSIKIGDRYVSYRRFDPFSTVLGIAADLVESYQELQTEADKSFVDTTMQMLTIAVARNITNKTYLTGITNVVNAIAEPERTGATLINNFAGSMVPFSGLVSQSIPLFSDDPVFREVRGITDAIRSKIPLIEESVAPRRNIFGEEIKKADRPPGPLTFLPVEFRDEIDDPIMIELRNLDHGFSRPSVTKNNLDLSQFTTTSGQQAYDRWLQLHGQVKIGGMTLRERLTKLIKNKQYQSLSDVSTDDYDSPRIRILRSVISKYRARAYYEMLKEAPTLREADRINFMNREALRRGASMEELQALIRSE